MDQTANRRDSVRYAAIENRVILAWREASGYQQIVAKLVNVSQSGGLFLAEKATPLRQPVWVRVDRPIQTEWSDAVIVRTTRTLKSRLTGKGPCLIRLRFLPSCPYDFFKLATHGPRLGDTTNLSRTSEQEIGLWH